MAPHEESHTLSLWFGSEQVEAHTEVSLAEHSKPGRKCCTLLCGLAMHVQNHSAAVLHVSKTQLCKQAVKKGSEQHEEDFFWSTYVD